MKSAILITFLIFSSVTTFPARSELLDRIAERLGVKTTEKPGFDEADATEDDPRPRRLQNIPNVFNFIQQLQEDRNILNELLPNRRPNHRFTTTTDKSTNVESSTKSSADLIKSEEKTSNNSSTTQPSTSSALTNGDAQTTPSTERVSKEPEKVEEVTLITVDDRISASCLASLCG